MLNRSTTGGLNQQALASWSHDLLTLLRERAAHATTDNTEYSLKLPLFGVTCGSLSPGTMDLAWDKPFLGEAELSETPAKLGKEHSRRVQLKLWQISDD